jgi:flavodoxin
MKPIVVYASKSGNTKKIADTIAAQIGAKAYSVSLDSTIVPLEDFDVIFAGTGIYAGSPNQDFEKYLTALNLKEPKQFVLFLTWGGAGRTNQQVKAKLQSILEAKGHKVLNEYFACYGGWKLLRRGRPNSDDVKAASEWAKKIVAQMDKA